MHPSSRLSVVAGVLALSVPLSAFAAQLTVTQQGVVSASAPRGAQRAVFLEVGVKAECDADVRVKSFTVRHRGLGDASDLVRVYVTDGDVRLSRTRSLDSSDRTATLELIPAYTVKACGTKYFQIRGDFSEEAAVAGEHGLIIEAVDAGGATVVLSGPTRTPVVTTRPVRMGTVNVAFLGLTRALQFGKNRTFARIRLDADHIANQEIRALTLVNDGKAADGDLKNLRIENRRGEVLTDTLDQLDGKTARFTFDPPLLVDRNASLVLELKGDIAASRSQTIRFILEEPSDLEATPRGR